MRIRPTYRELDVVKVATKCQKNKVEWSQSKDFDNFYRAHKVMVAMPTKLQNDGIFEMFIKRKSSTKRAKVVKQRCETSDGIL